MYGDGYMKRILAMITLIALAVSTSACNPNRLPTAFASTTGSQAATPYANIATPTPASATPSTTAIQPSPSPTPEATTDIDNGDDESPLQNDIPDLVTVGLTEDQYSQINTLLSSALEVPFFTKPSELKKVDLLNFTAHALKWGVLDDQVSGLEFSKEDIEKVIKSAFTLDYRPRAGDTYEGDITYKDGKFTIFDGDYESGEDARTYSISRLSPGKLLLKFNIVGVSDIGDGYGGKGQAVIEEDKDSLFGYHLVSLTKGKETVRRFDDATASSCLPSKGEKTFTPGNAIDGKDQTAWATTMGKDEWIELRFDKPRDITGLNFGCGNWSSEDLFNSSGQPSTVRLEFSNGLTITTERCWSEIFEGPVCITFGRPMTITSVKITITDSISIIGASHADVYITDITPF
jgi:hypothetical protein